MTLRYDGAGTYRPLVLGDLVPLPAVVLQVQALVHGAELGLALVPRARHVLGHLGPAHEHQSDRPGITIPAGHVAAYHPLESPVPAKFFTIYIYTRASNEPSRRFSLLRPRVGVVKCKFLVYLHATLALVLNNVKVGRLAACSQVHFKQDYLSESYRMLI